LGKIKETASGQVHVYACDKHNVSVPNISPVVTRSLMLCSVFQIRFDYTRNIPESS